MHLLRDITRWLALRRLREIRTRSGRGYHEIVRQRRQRQARRGRFRRTCIRLTYQVPIAILVALGFVVIILHSGDRRVLKPEEIAAAGFGYNLTSFEVANLPAKWTHRIYSALPWTDIDYESRTVLLDRFTDLAHELRRARDAHRQALARNDEISAGIHQTHIDNLITERNQIRDAVEELLEAAISSELINIGLHQDSEFIWPPVDFRIDDTPHVLVTSPRDKIERHSVRLLQPELSEQEKLQMETQLFGRADLSAVVLRTGGLASYPNLVPSDYSLQSLLEVSAHEWLHAYLIFHPLGRAYWANPDMTSLNETLANLFGKEIGRTVYNQLTGKDIPTLEPPYMPDQDKDDHDDEAFDPRQFLHETRRQAETLLSEGKITEAETYMETRRQTLVENGHNIRKINQAYFAFHGTYADSPSSTSPLAHQIYQLRLTSPNAGHLVKTLQTINNIQDFQALLKTQNINQSPTHQEQIPSKLRTPSLRRRRKRGRPTAARCSTVPQTTSPLPHPLRPNPLSPKTPDNSEGCSPSTESEKTRRWRGKDLRASIKVRGSTPPRSHQMAT